MVHVMTKNVPPEHKESTDKLNRRIEAIVAELMGLMDGWLKETENQPDVGGRSAFVIEQTAQQLAIMIVADAAVRAQPLLKDLFKSSEAFEFPAPFGVGKPGEA